MAGTFPRSLSSSTPALKCLCKINQPASGCVCGRDYGSPPTLCAGGFPRGIDSYPPYRTRTPTDPLGIHHTTLLASLS